jgi:hypothetical protein
MQRITDIWFRTKLDIQEVCVRIGLSRKHYGYENEWEWMIGYLNDNHLDVTRLHSVDPLDTDTRIFLLGNSREFDRELIEKIVKTLKEIDVEIIYLGQWLYNEKEFDLVVVETK